MILDATQLVATVDQSHLAGEAGQERRLLEGGVATTDDDDVLLAEEEAVTGRTPADAVTRQPVLALDLELAVARAHREHDGLGLVGRAVGER